MSKHQKRIFLTGLLFIGLLFPSCAKEKTIKNIVEEGKTSYMTGTWDISFKKFSSTDSEKPIESESMTVIISPMTEVHNKKEVNEIDLIRKEENGKETKESMNFDELLNILDSYDQKFYIDHDIKKFERNDPKAKYSLKGSRFAKRDSKHNEYDEIIAKQTLIKKSKGKKEETTILFEMEKRIRNSKLERDYD